MTDQEFADWAHARIAELERWQKVDLANYKRHVDELTEMLIAATDTATQRGKRIDQLESKLSRLEGLAQQAVSLGAHPDAPLFSPRAALAAIGIGSRDWPAEVYEP
jgi:hypothetical protein